MPYSAMGRLPNRGPERLCVAWRMPALAELAEVADGRVDLLAEQAGLAIGFHN